MTAQRNTTRHPWSGRPDRSHHGMLVLMAAIAVAVLLAPARPVQAQGGGTDLRERLRQAIERTDEMLIEAFEIVENSESERARRLLRNAKMIQDSAWNWFDRCGVAEVRACSNASEATTRSRREIRHAIQVAREESSQERAAHQTMDRVQQMLEEALSSIPGETADQERSLRLLNQAQLQLERAREQFSERHFKVALQLAQSSSRLVQQALHLEGGQNSSPDRVLRELERTERLMERAGPAIGESGMRRAVELFERATSLQLRARQAYQDQKMRLSLRLTQETRQQVQRALRLIQGPADPGQVQRAIEQTDNLIERAMPIIRDAGQERPLQLLEKGLERQVKAKEHLEAPQLQAALAQTRVARRLVQEALDMIDREGQLGL